MLVDSLQNRNALTKRSCRLAGLRVLRRRLSVQRPETDLGVGFPDRFGRSLSTPPKKFIEFRDLRSDTPRLDPETPIGLFLLNRSWCRM